MQRLRTLADQGVAETAILVWQLRGVDVVTCTVRRSAEGVELQIIHGSRRFAREHWPDIHRALARAWDIRRELLALGWYDEQGSF